MNNTLMYLTQLEWSYIGEKVWLKLTPSEKLAAFIESSLDYQATYRLNNTGWENYGRKQDDIRDKYF
ncbi:hypothetical protein [Paenibacillus jiagnxiensis]|uniref:hypothetical protein n=1 Tax=Paenibacillus jiagnxiensis TaxID=3228926 RepID=UPI0033A34617